MEIANEATESRRAILSDPRKWKSLLDRIPDPKEPAQRRALSWLLFPDYYLSVVSTDHRRAIRNTFADLLLGDEVDEDDELHQIRSELERRRAGTSLYSAPLLDSWDPGRTTSGVSVALRHLAARTQFKTHGYVIASAAINLVPWGHWTTYSDIARAAGLIAGQVGEYVNSIEHPAGHRVIKIDGTTYTQDNRSALEAEGVTFDERGCADPNLRVSSEDLREQLDAQGLLPKVARRAWLIRGSNVNGQDLAPSWLESGQVTLSATSLRNVEPGVGRDQLKSILDEDYAHVSYSVRAEKLDDFHAFLTRMQPGDIVATGHQEHLLVGRISGDAHYHAAPDGPALLSRDVEWSDGAGTEYVSLPGELAARVQVQRDVVDLTQQLESLEALAERVTGDDPRPGPGNVVLPDPTDELARKLHVPKAWLQECIDLLNDRPQLIFYGPPGTGKTYLAQAIAKHVAGDNVRLVQFHPSYAYEDFFEGYRPEEGGGFRLKPGPMRKVVDQAVENPRSAFVIIIDEINRGNLAKVFGELYFLLEYRDQNVELLYADGDFSLPRNVYIIGTMNTADRSIALVDSAMRRRFAFLSLHPEETPTKGVLRRWLAANGYSARVADLLDELNSRIVDPDFKIGPSYFMRPAVHESAEALERTWRTSILPLLEEHHFGELDTIGVRDRYCLDSIVAALNRVRYGPADDRGDDAITDTAGE